jgi:hypothetical protein
LLSLTDAELAQLIATSALLPVKKRAAFIAVSRTPPPISRKA